MGLAIRERIGLDEWRVGSGVNDEIVVYIADREEVEHGSLLHPADEGRAAALLHDHVRTGGRNRSDDVGELRIGLGDAIACQQLKLRIDLLAFQQEQILRVNSSRTIGTAEDEVLLALILRQPSPGPLQRTRHSGRS